MVTKRDIELAIRASDTTSKRTFEGSAKSVNVLTDAVERQSAAMEAGEVSAADLDKTLKALRQTGTELARQQGLIEVYADVSAKFQDATEKAQALREAANALKASQATSTTTTKEQAQELTRLESDANKAEKRVNGLAKSVQTYATKLADAGIDADRFAEFTEKIAIEAQKVGTAMAATSGALENYETVLARVAKREKEAADAAQVASEQRRQALLREQAFVDDLNAALKEQEAVDVATRKEAEARRIDAATAAYKRFEQAVRDGTRAMKEQEELTAFRQVAEDSLARDRNMGGFSASAAKASPAVASFREQLAGIVAPTTEALKTLDGLEAQIVDITERLGEAEKPFANYQQELIDLAKAQAALLAQATLIDTYRQQADEVEFLTGKLEQQREELRAHAAAMKAANAPSADMTAELKRRETAVNQTVIALDREQRELGQLSTALDRASIDVKELTAAEQRLRVVADQAASAQGRLQKSSQQGKGGTFGFLGLSPYALTNLGYQINDVVTQIASGTSVMQTFAQQAGQILQIFPGIFGAIATYLPIIAAVAAALFVVYKVVKQITDTAESVRQFSAALALSADGLEYNAEQLAAVSDSLTRYGIKIEDARKATKQFMEEGVDPDRLQQFGAAAEMLSQALGADLPEALNKMSGAFTQGYDAVAKLDDEVNFLTATERSLIEEMFKSGRAVEARALAFDRFFAKVGDASDKARGRWSDSWRALSNVMADFFKWIGDATGITQFIRLLDMLGDKLDEVSRRFNDARDAATGYSTASSGGQDATGAYANITEKDRVALAKIAAVESGAGAGGYEAVAATVINRAVRSGKSIEEVIGQKGQFEALPKYRNMTFPEFDSRYKAARPRIDSLLASGIDPTGGAVNFYAPRAQAQLARVDGRPVTPAWAKPELQTITAGGQNYYRGSFPGDRGPQGAAPPTQESQRTTKALNDLAEAYTEAAKAQNELTDAQVLARERQEAVQRVADAGGDPNSPQGMTVVEAALDAKRAELAKKRRQQQIELERDLNALMGEAAREQDQSLDQRVAAIRAKFAAANATVDKARAQGLESIMVSGKSMTLKEYEDQIDALEEIAVRMATIKFYEDQLVSLEAQRSNQLKRIQSDLTLGMMTAEEANRRIAESTDELLPKFEKLVDDTRAFKRTLSDAELSPSTLAFFDKVETAVPLALAEGAKTQMKNLEDQVNYLVQERDTAIGVIMDKLAEPGADVLDLYRQAIALQEEWNPKIATAARNAADLARALGVDLPGSKAGAAVAKFDSIANSASRPSATNSGSARIGAAATAAEEQRLNEIISARAKEVSALNLLAEAGAISEEDRRNKTREAYEQTAPLIAEEIKRVEELYEARRAAGEITQEAYDAEIANLHLLAVQAGYVDERFKELRETIYSSLEDNLFSGVSESIERVAYALESALDGTDEWGEALSDIGEIAQNMLAQMLIDIGQAIIRMQLLEALRSSETLSKIIDTTGNAAGLTTGATAVAAASTQLTAASATLEVAGTTLGAASTALGAAGPAIGTAGTTLGAAGASVGTAGAAMVAPATLLAGAGTALAGTVAPLGAVAASLLAAAAALQLAAAQMQAAAAAETAANLASVFHGGTSFVGGAQSGLKRAVSPRAFVNAPRYHSGVDRLGLRSNEHAAILETGETVLDKYEARDYANAKAGGGGGNGGVRSLAIYNMFDSDEVVASAMNQPATTQAVINFVKQNAETINLALNRGN